MSGGAAGLHKQDDPRVGSGEKIWRFIQKEWYKSDPNIPGSPKEIQEQAFSDNLSIVRREALAPESKVDTVHGGKFASFGILELTSDQYRSVGCVFEYDHDQEWGQDVHFEGRRVGQTNLQKLNNTQKKQLANLANQRSLLRDPKP